MGKMEPGILLPRGLTSVNNKDGRWLAVIGLPTCGHPDDRGKVQKQSHCEHRERAMSWRNEAK